MMNSGMPDGLNKVKHCFTGDARVNDFSVEMVDRERDTPTRLDWGYSW